MQNPLSYYFHPGDHGLFVEIYLPKKARFQGIVYQVLEEGFDIYTVREHLLDEKKQERIRRMLEKYMILTDYEYTRDRVSNMEQLFFGYSMYEVDGVFLSRDKSVQLMRTWEGKRKEERPRKDLVQLVSEERVQIIRFMFLPNIEPIYEKLDAAFDTNPQKFTTLRNLVRSYLHQGMHNEEALKKATPKKYREDYNKIIDYLKGWTDDVCIFLYGYIIYRLCERIEELQEQEGQEPEQEIWLTWFSNLAINRITRYADHK